MSKFGKGASDSWPNVRTTSKRLSLAINHAAESIFQNLRSVSRRKISKYSLVILDFCKPLCALKLSLRLKSIDVKFPLNN